MMAFRKNTSLKQFLGTNIIKEAKNFLLLNKQQPQVNVPNFTPVDHFAANKFSKQQHLQALKPGRRLQFLTKTLAKVTLSCTY